MVAFYSQGDQEIYDEGEHFIPQEYYRLNKFNNTVAPMPPETIQEPTQNFGIPYTGAFTGGGGGGGLGGKFGNLDLSKTKTFNKNVYKTTGPVKGWDMSEITGYYDPQTHTYKTLEGKNIEHGGHFTGDPKEGDIEGVDFQFPSMFAMLKKMKEKIGDTFTGGQASQADIDAANLGAAQEIGATGPQWHTSKGGQDQPGAGGQNVKSSSGDVYGGAAAGYNEAAEKSDYYADGGRIGYNRGRVVNPGGYAGDEEGGILEWLKSKMGSESETNPTVFGTQNSLLNQGSIAQLEDAIKSYEALMMMGDLDEEQQDDYELKLNQLSALTEGATQKAHGGRVPFFYGGLARLL